MRREGDLLGGVEMEEAPEFHYKNLGIVFQHQRKVVDDFLGRRSAFELGGDEVNKGRLLFPEVLRHLLRNPGSKLLSDDALLFHLRRVSQRKK